MSDVADNAHDRDPLRIGRHSAHDDAFSYRVFVRPEFPGERLIDNDHERRIRIIGLGKEPSSYQRRSDGVEIIGRYFAFFFVGIRILRSSGRPSIANDESPLVPAKGRTVVRPTA